MERLRLHNPTGIPSVFAGFCTQSLSFLRLLLQSQPIQLATHFSVSALLVSQHRPPTMNENNLQPASAGHYNVEEQHIDPALLAWSYENPPQPSAASHAGLYSDQGNYGMSSYDITHGAPSQEHYDDGLGLGFNQTFDPTQDCQTVGTMATFNNSFGAGNQSQSWDFPASQQMFGANPFEAQANSSALPTFAGTAACSDLEFLQQSPWDAPPFTASMQSAINDNQPFQNLAAGSWDDASSFALGAHADGHPEPVEAW